MTEFVKLVYDDWEALYADGEAVEQQHANRISVGKQMEGHTVESFTEEYVAVPAGRGQYPSQLEDVPGYES